MTARGTPVRERIKSYLSTLSPQARGMLVRAAESALERGERDVSLETVLAVIREIDAAESFDRIFEQDPEPAASAYGAGVVRATAPVDPVAAQSWAARLRQEFFRPLEPFLVDVILPARQVGLIFEPHLDLIWTFIGRDLMPDHMTELLSLDDAGLASDPRAVAAELRLIVAPAARTYLADAAASTRGQQRLRAQLGNDTGYADFLDCLHVFENEEAYSRILGRLPKVLTAFDMSETGPVSDLIGGAMRKRIVDGRFLAAALAKRLANPGHLINLALRIGGSEDPKVVAQTPAIALADIILAEIDRNVAICESLARSHRTTASLVQRMKTYHEIVRHVSMVIDLEQAPEWSRRISAARRRLSDLLIADIEQAPGLMRRALRDGVERSFKDTAMLEDAERAMTLLDTARATADSLALNDAITRARKSAEQVIETLNGKVMDALRRADTSDRGNAVRHVDAMIRFAAIIFGEDYALVLRRTRDTIVQKTPSRAVI